MTAPDILAQDSPGAAEDAAMALAALPIEHLATLSDARRAALLDRGRTRLDDLRAAVRPILDDVHARGDVALLDYAERFDRARPIALRVPRAEIAAALECADADYVAALRTAAAGIERFHRAQREALAGEAEVETAPGVRVWRVWRPLERVGVYVPGGGALYPSCLLMAAIPARVAGCAEVAVCTPPGSDGRVPSAVLAAAALVGVDEVYAVGGAQSIAALAYGTETIRRVDKIFGAGGPYVTAAKSAVAGEVAIDMPAGPSEVLIVADETAHPEYVAADLLAQAEHVDATCVLIATSEATAQAVRTALARQVGELATAATIAVNLRRNGALLVARDAAAALAFANDYAAEHLQLVVADADALVGQVRHAGSVFLGPWSPTAAGDYASGGNHTLPTAGSARGFAPLSVESFGRKMQVQHLERDGLAGLRSAIETLAAHEGLPAHGASIAARFADGEGAR